MTNSILTREFLTRHANLKVEHDRWDKLYHASDAMVKDAVAKEGPYYEYGFIVELRESLRRMLNQKLLALEYSEIYEVCREPRTIYTLYFKGPDTLGMPPIPDMTRPPMGTLTGETLEPVKRGRHQKTCEPRVSLTSAGYIDHLIATTLPAMEELTT